MEITGLITKEKIPSLPAGKLGIAVTGELNPWSKDTSRKLVSNGGRSPAPVFQFYFPTASEAHYANSENLLREERGNHETKSDSNRGCGDSD